MVEKATDLTDLARQSKSDGREKKGRESTPVGQLES